MKRVVTALFLVPIAVYSALFAPWWVLFGVIALTALLCFREYAAITGSFAPLVFSWLAGRGASATRLDPHDVRSARELRARLSALLTDERLFVERLDQR